MINKDEVKNILISRTDRLGDVILTLPLIPAAKRIFSNARLSFLGREYVKKLIHDYEGIDEFISIDSEDISGSFSKKLKLIRNKKFDLVINVKPEFDLALLFYLSGIKYRIGTGYRWYSFLYNYKVYEHRKVSDKHESEYNLNLLGNFFPDTENKKIFSFRYSGEDKNSFREKMLKDNLHPLENYIIIHPGSSGSAMDLPAYRFSEVIGLLLKKYPDQKIVLTGLNNERELIARIIKNIGNESKGRIIDLSGKLDLRELMILIDNSKLFISNSTGPIHIAGALNKNIIGFYPNEETMSSTRWKPLSDNCVIINPSQSNNMESIDPEKILSSAEKYL
ncbi:MAG TPA: glycosyltransferase family 9 protein [Ignavibacteria bacterium]|nr:glycosyltransferase family 9 protein [Ignavibacteria bacterium]HMR39866.1 glycosyltransferase family 9 protein [Ignavibacteria bacterium]